jgi:hypothetical protein
MNDQLLVAFTAALQRRQREDQAQIVRSAMAEGAQALDKRLIKIINFAGDLVKVFTANGQYVRTPREDGGLGVLDFTMGANWYAGDPPGMYYALCEENEVVLHNLLSPVDFLATLIHELTERWAMKTFGLDYDTAHELVANVAENWARAVMGRPTWNWGSAA